MNDKIRRRRSLRIPLLDIDNWREIGATLSRNRTRTLMTGFGIFWGVFMLAALVGGAQGAKDMLLSEFQGFATNSAILFPGTTSMPYHGYAGERKYDLDLTDLERLRRGVPELGTVTGNMYQMGCTFATEKYSVSGQAMGAWPDYVRVMQPVIYSGRFINGHDMNAGRKVCVIGKRIAEQVYPGVADPVGRPLRINGITYTIVGMAGQETDLSLGGRIDQQVIIPLTTFRRAFGRGDNLDIIMLVARGKESISALEPRIRRIIYSRHYIHPDDTRALNIFDISEEFAKVDKLFLGVSFLAAFIGFSTLIAGIIGIGNIMWVIVRERTQEIGIRRAIGSKPRDIIVQILSEGMVLTAVAGVLGLSVAVVALGVTQHLTAKGSFVPQFLLTPGQAAWIIGVFLVLGSAAGLIPAFKAMKIKPVEALNSR